MNLGSTLTAAALVATGLCACALDTNPPRAPALEAATTVFLVRHAERGYDGSDPGLTPAGHDRAIALGDEIADRLGETPLVAVYSTAYRRTLETAAPTADRYGLAVERYDPSDLAAFAETLRSREGAVLVVGHSNTTPEFVALLGGDPGGPIDDASEFDRFYEVSVGRDGGVRASRSRYGD